MYCNNNPVSIVDPDGDDWFYSQKDGSIYYNSTYTFMSTFDLGGHPELKGMSYLGPNGMFSKDKWSNNDRKLLAESNAKVVDIKDWSKGPINGAKTLGYEAYLEKGEASKFMGLQHYSLRPILAMVHRTETSATVVEPSITGQITAFHNITDEIEKSLLFAYVKYGATSQANPITPNNPYKPYKDDISSFGIQTNQSWHLMSISYDGESFDASIGIKANLTNILKDINEIANKGYFDKQFQKSLIDLWHIDAKVLKSMKPLKGVKK